MTSTPTCSRADIKERLRRLLDSVNQHTHWTLAYSEGNTKSINMTESSNARRQKMSSGRLWFLQIQPSKELLKHARARTKWTMTPKVYPVGIKSTKRMKIESPDSRLLTSISSTKTQRWKMTILIPTPSTIWAK